MLRFTLWLALAGLWALAVIAWPDLPERIPVHFDAAGRPDAWEPRSLLSWFGLPVLATVMGLAFGELLPRWIVRMAANNSVLLNVPDKVRFRALPEAARVRAVRPTVTAMRWVAIWVTLLFAWLVYGITEVAMARWTSVSMGPAIVCVVLILASVLVAAIAGKRAVQREINMLAG